MEHLGDEPTEILILFNSGEYQEIALSQWLGANPVSILETNFGISRDQIDKLPASSAAPEQAAEDSLGTLSGQGVTLPKVAAVVARGHALRPVFQ